MGLSIIYFSDIHIKGDLDFICKEVDKLKRACTGDLNRNNDVVIIISGDIAYSGKSEEYETAKKIIDEISRYIEQETNRRIHHIFVPGNHDCDFEKDSDIRRILLDSIKNDSISSDVFEKINSLQDAYGNFCKQYGLNDIGLVNTKSIDVGNDKILFIMINSAWMSKLHEEQGKLIIPKNFLPDINAEEYRAVFSVIHHPISWFNSSYKKNLIDYMRKTTDMIFVGHEHQQDYYNTDGIDWKLTEIHAKQLQDSEGDESQFSIINFDNLFEAYEIINYSWQNNKYIRTNKLSRDFIKNPLIYNSVYQPNDSMMKYINDIGININHFNNEEVYLSDLYVWPELIKSTVDGNKSEIKIKDNVFKEIKSNRLSIIIGDLLSGKTSLSKNLYSKYIESGNCCLLANGKDFDSYDDNKIKETIENIFIRNHQEQLIDDFRQLERSKKTIIIDGFDNIKYVWEKRNYILSYIYNMFDSVILTVSSDFELPQILSAECLSSKKDIPLYEILPMGNRKRSELVHKWYSLGNSLDHAVKKQRIENSILEIDTVLGKSSGFMPANPAFIINILQSSDAISNSTFAGSQYSFLYESLIKKSLSVVANEYNQAGTYNIDINVLSKLAFTMLIKKSKTFDEKLLKDIAKDLSEKLKIDINASSLLERMTKAKILFKEIDDIEEYRFRYPYIFYYFCGHYIAYNLEEDDVRNQIEYMRSRLYNENYGNIMIFVCHFSNNKEIIESILLSAYSIFEKYKPFDFEEKNPLIDNINVAIKALLPENIGDNNEVKMNKQKKLLYMDDAGINDGKVKEPKSDIDEPSSEKENDLLALSAAFKTLDVLGQILQNYPGDIDGKLKVEIIDEIHKLGMRSVQAIMSTMKLLQDEWINALVKRVTDKDKIMRKDKIVIQTKNIFTFILSGMVRGMISKIASSINSKHLVRVAKETFEKDNTISENLVLQELKYNCLNEPNIYDIFTLYDELKNANNGFAICVLKSIVANYLKYNECDYKLRAKLCSKFELNSKNSFISNQKKMLQNI